MTKLNAYVGFVTPVISCTSPMWFANETETKSIERIQRKATSWILRNSSKSYEERLMELKLLQLSHCVELQHQNSNQIKQKR